MGHGKVILWPCLSRTIQLCSRGGIANNLPASYQGHPENLPFNGSAGIFKTSTMNMSIAWHVPFHVNVHELIILKVSSATSETIFFARRSNFLCFASKQF